MTSYIVAGRAIGSRALTPPWNNITDQMHIGDTISLTLSGPDEATLIGGGLITIPRFPGLTTTEFSDTSTQQATHAFDLGPRTNPALAFPVATIQPEGAAEQCAFDIAPSSGATAQNNNGFAWIDVVDGPVIDAVTFNNTSMRVGNGAKVGALQVGDVSTRKFGSASAIPLALCADWDGSSNPQIYMSPRTATNPTIVLGWDGSDALVGVLAPIATNSTKGFLYIPTMAGAPAGTPHWTNANGGSPIVVDTSNSKIWVNIAGSWKGVVVA